MEITIVLNVYLYCYRLSYVQFFAQKHTETVFYSLGAKAHLKKTVLNYKPAIWYRKKEDWYIFESSESTIKNVFCKILDYFNLEFSFTSNFFQDDNVTDSTLTTAY